MVLFVSHFFPILQEPFSFYPKFKVTDFAIPVKQNLAQRPDQFLARNLVFSAVKRLELSVFSVYSVAKKKK